MVLSFAFMLGCLGPMGTTEEDSGIDTAGADTNEPEPDHDNLVDSVIPASYAGIVPSRVIFLGDSITAGNGASKQKLAYTALLEDNDDNTWPDSSDLDLPGLFDPAPEIIDDSRAGATTASLVGQQLDYVTSDIGDTVSGPTAVVVTIAGNDMQAIIMTPSKAEETAASVTDNLAEFYDYFQDPVRFPDGSLIFLTNVYEPSDGVGSAEECFYGLDLTKALPALDTINAATRAQAEERDVAWIDLHGHFLGHGYHAGDTENPYYQESDPSLWFASDCIHPNDRGHHEIRRLFWYALAGQEFPGDVPVAAE